MFGDLPEGQTHCAETDGGFGTYARKHPVAGDAYIIAKEFWQAAQAAMQPELDAAKSDALIARQANVNYRKENDLLLAKKLELSTRIELLEYDMKSGDYETLYAQAVHELAELTAQVKLMREGLNSIAKNGCCNQCQEASLVAKQILKYTLLPSEALAEYRKKIFTESLEYERGYTEGIDFCRQELRCRAKEE